MTHVFLLVASHMTFMYVYIVHVYENLSYIYLLSFLCNWEITQKQIKIKELTLKR